MALRKEKDKVQSFKSEKQSRKQKRDTMRTQFLSMYKSAIEPVRKLQQQKRKKLKEKPLTSLKTVQERHK